MIPLLTADETRAAEQARRTLSEAKEEAGQVVGQARAQAAQLIADGKAEIERRHTTTRRELDDLTAQRDEIASHLAVMREALGAVMPGELADGGGDGDGGGGGGGVDGDHADLGPTMGS